MSTVILITQSAGVNGREYRAARIRHDDLSELLGNQAYELDPALVQAYFADDDGWATPDDALKKIERSAAKITLDFRDTPLDDLAQGHSRH